MHRELVMGPWPVYPMSKTPQGEDRNRMGRVERLCTLPWILADSGIM